MRLRQSFYSRFLPGAWERRLCLRLRSQAKTPLRGLTSSMFFPSFDDRVQMAELVSKRIILHDDQGVVALHPELIKVSWLAAHPYI